MSLAPVTDAPKLTRTLRAALGLVDLNLFGKPGLLCAGNGAMVYDNECPRYTFTIVRMGMSAPAETFYLDPYYEDP